MTEPGRNDLLQLHDLISEYARVRLCKRPDGIADGFDYLLGEKQRFWLCRLLRESTKTPECACGFSSDACTTNPCMRKKVHRAGLVDDLPERLRNAGCFGFSGNLYERAADEIDRLRAEVRRLGPMGGEKEPTFR